MFLSHIAIEKKESKLLKMYQKNSFTGKISRNPYKKKELQSFRI